MVIAPIDPKLIPWPQLPFPTYLVGGAVRDFLLGVKPADFDFVVTQATPADLLNLGFKAVGKFFPVFLDPIHGHEVALARRERKVAPGHQGFTFDANSDVTLEQDLGRRDFTINAMAFSREGELIDPFGGREDLLQRRLLRALGPHLAEDPLRLWRALRQKNTFSLTLETQTIQWMKQLQESGELQHLSLERILQEYQKAWNVSPEVFCGFLVDVQRWKLWSSWWPHCYPQDAELMSSLSLSSAVLLQKDTDDLAQWWMLLLAQVFCREPEAVFKQFYQKNVGLWGRDIFDGVKLLNQEYQFARTRSLIDGKNWLKALLRRMNHQHATSMGNQKKFWRVRALFLQQVFPIYLPLTPVVITHLNQIIFERIFLLNFPDPGLFVQEGDHEAWGAMAQQEYHRAYDQVLSYFLSRYLKQ